MPRNILVSMDTGSRVYGLADPESDYDRITVLWPTRDQLFGMEKPVSVHKIWGVVDAKQIDLRLYAASLNKHAVSMVETLFTPWSQVFDRDPAYEELRESRHMFLDAKFIRHCMGYIKSALNGREKERMHALRVGQYAREASWGGPLLLPCEFSWAQALKEVKSGVRPVMLSDLYDLLEELEELAGAAVERDTTSLLNQWLYQSLRWKWGTGNGA